MKIDFNVTDEQLLAFGVPRAVIDLSRASYFRPYSEARWEAQSLDLSYVNNINDARDRVSLAALAINNPDEKSIRFPVFGEAYIGIVRHELSEPKK